MILLIDNYDSFVFNLARYVGEAGRARRVIRNDAISLAGIEALAPAGIILSPGPCTPEKAGISNAVVRHFGPRLPILGVCLGHQCIAGVYGATLRRARHPMHGRESPITHDGSPLFAGIDSPFAAARYHSLAVDIDAGGPLIVSARAAADGEIMALRHPDHPVYGVQFHPESVLTPDGHGLLVNFLDICAAWGQRRGPRRLGAA